MVSDDRVELLTVRNAADVPLDGVLWMPARGVEPVAAMVHLHAKGGNFYTGPGRFIPEHSRELPIAHLALNMRCHDLGTTRGDLPSGDLFGDPAPFGRGAKVDGGMWERIGEGCLDVEAAVALLRGRGLRRIFLAGHSSGGFYAAQGAALDPAIAGRVLLSPLTGNRTALPQWFADEAELEATLERARAMVAEGRGEQLIPLKDWYYGIAARALLERAAEPDGLWDGWMAASSAPVLLLSGEHESRGPMWDAALEALPLPAEQRARVVIAGAEHHYIGYERAVADAVTRFVLTHWPG